jgi:hypothetical protein
MDEARRGGYGYELMPVLKREYQCAAAVGPRTRPAYPPPCPRASIGTPNFLRLTHPSLRTR